MPEESTTPDLVEVMADAVVARATTYASIDDARAGAERLAEKRG
jgi:hypothetical protein